MRKTYALMARKELEIIVELEELLNTPESQRVETFNNRIDLHQARADYYKAQIIEAMRRG